ncbi:MAG: Chromosome partition protein smc [Myxococcaceae bacterium]|nr:Chromosome partition protein smc [Myxococcaceae bacterium]
MKLKMLEICGFKSFVDRTVVRFDHDITGVVGPNGCGKSNIVDAIRWSMGEQSAKHLRGKSMDDVIFNGSEARGPHSFAEVTITFDNSDGNCPIEYKDYAELAVTRRLTRDGDSSYFLNKTPVRLMDITALFLGTGVGTKAYSIIEQGRIGLIVTAKPEERRHLIEEAAGITKFKAHKQKAERKMEQTRQNLLRITDILGELEKSLASLKRQAQKAARYKEYRDEQRDLELWMASHKYLELHALRSASSAQLAAVAAEGDGLRTGLVTIEAELEAERLDLAREEHAVREATERSHQAESAVRLLETQIKHNLERLSQLKHSEAAAERELSEIRAQRDRFEGERAQLEQGLSDLIEVEEQEASVLERELELHEQKKRSAAEADQAMNLARSRVADATTRIARAEAVLSQFERRRSEAFSRLERLRNEREDLEMRTLDLSEQTRELAARLSGLRSDKQTSVERKAELEHALEDMKKGVREGEQKNEQVRTELAERRSRMRSLEQIQQRFEGVGAGVRALMQRAQTDASLGVLGMLADRLDCPSAYTQALAGALGDRLQYVVVQDEEAGLSAVTWLREQKKGRATIIPQQPAPRQRVDVDFAQLEGVVGRLSELVRFSADDRTLVENLLGDIVVVEDVATARRIRGAQPGEYSLVTRQGEVLGADGRHTGGSGEDAGAHMLEVKREIRELQPLVLRLEQEQAECQARLSDLRTTIARSQAELDAARSEGHDAELAIVRSEKDLKRADEELARARDRVEQLAFESDDLSSSLAEASQEETESRSEIDSARRARTEAEEDFRGYEQTSRERRSAVERQNAVVTEIRVRAAEARQRVQSDRMALDRVERGLAELALRLARVEAELVSTVEHQGQTAAQVLLDRESLGDEVTRAKQAEAELSGARARYEERKLLLSGREQNIKELRTRIDRTTKAATELALKERELSLGLVRLLEQISERHRLDLRLQLDGFHTRELPDDNVQERAKELDRLLERMGPINLTAIEEFEEQSKRYDYLIAQKADLDSAIEQLETAIKQMNRESKKLFRDTFDSVAARFSQIFPKMFGGGEAKLRLTNPEDMLETGVEILAQPPGKRLGAMELMSGGEKALTAVSLIFALFQHKPSPFCLLDEVDAPLDEANIGRFAEAVRSMTHHSQFIVITHSKRTMEIADVLYGVTMERPGISTLVSVELRQGSQKKQSEERSRSAVA